MAICRLSINYLVLKSGLRSCLAFPTLRLRQYSSKKVEDEEQVEEPVKFSESRASKWTAKQSFGQPAEDPDKEPPRIQGPVVNLSLIVFMIYFFILREENDIDETLKDLYKPLPGFAKES